METDSAEQALAELEPAPEKRRHHTIAWLSGVAVIAAVIAGSVAIAGNNATAWPSTVVLSGAAARTTSTGTARVSLSATLTLPGDTSTLITGDGAYDYGANASAVTFRVGSTTEELRTVRHVAYLSVPSGALPGGAHWLSITAADIKMDPQAGAIFSSNDPSSGLQLLSAIGNDPRIVGRETVDGIDVTRYEFTLDLKTLFDRVGKASEALKSSSFARQLQALGSAVNLRKIPSAAWLDSNGRIRKFIISIEATIDGEHGKVVDEFRFSHFGEPVDVHAPPASDTVPFSDVHDIFSDNG